SDHVAQQITRQTPLPCVDQGKPVLQLTFRFFRHLNLLHSQVLINSRIGRNELYPVCQTADLILPAASRAHDLLHAEHNVIDLIFRPVQSEKFKNSLYTCSREDTARPKPGAFRYTVYLGGKIN